MLEPRNFYVKLPGDVADALIRVADDQWRLPRDQAAYIIERALRAEGALTDPKNAAGREPATVA